MYMHAACVCAHVYVHKASYCVITKLNRSNIIGWVWSEKRLTNTEPSTGRWPWGSQEVVQGTPLPLSL